MPVNFPLGILVGLLWYGGIAVEGAGMPDRVVAGRYRLTQVLGRGAMGVVWRAADELIGRAVAVKELRVPPELSDRERSMFGERALREARTAGRLNHPGVVAIHDLVPTTPEDDAVYIVMELVEAPTLAEVLERYRTLPENRVVRMAGQLLGALEAAHSIGLVHRDVKPGNVMVLPGDKVKLVDFGIAHAMDDTRLTHHGIAGSTGYMAPELFQGAAPSPPADLWSLGATLFHATEGRAPFARQTPAATLHAILHDHLPPLNSTPPLSTLISGLLTRDTTSRITSQQADALLQSAAPPTVAPAGPSTAVRQDEPTTIRRTTRSPDTPQAAAPTRSGEGTWEDHPTTVTPTITPPYAVVPPKSAKATYGCISILLLAALSLLLFWLPPSHLVTALPFIVLLLSFSAMTYKEHKRRFRRGWVNPARERITFSKHNPASTQADFITWEHIEEVIIARITWTGQEDSREARTAVIFHIAARMPRNNTSTPMTPGGTEARPRTWTLTDFVAPADVVEAHFRAVAPPSIRVTREDDIERTEPGPFRITLLVILLAGSAVGLWQLIKVVRP